MGAVLIPNVCIHAYIGMYSLPCEMYRPVTEFLCGGLVPACGVFDVDRLRLHLANKMLILKLDRMRHMLWSLLCDIASSGIAVVKMGAHRLVTQTPDSN